MSSLTGSSPGSSPGSLVAPAKTSQRLRVAVLNRNFDPTGGGAERYSIAMVENLAALHDIHVFAQSIAHHHPGVSYHKVSKPLARPRWINQLWFAFATWRATRSGFDVVHSHENTWHGQVQTVHVLPIRHNLFVGRAGWRRALRWLKVVTSPRLLVYLWLENLRYAARPGRTLVVTSNSLQRVMAQTHPHTVPMLKVITPGVETAPGAALPADKLAARQQLGLPEQGAVLLFVANDFQKKGLPALLKAVALLSKRAISRGPEVPAPVTLAMVGNAKHAAAFAAQIKHPGLEPNVVFLGQLADVSVAYQAADILVHPTLEDTFGMVVLEAMAHGLPVVVSAGRYCGIAEDLTHEINAMVLQDPTDSHVLAETLQALMNNEHLRARLGQAATGFATRHQWPNLCKLQNDTYFASIGPSNNVLY